MLIQNFLAHPVSSCTSSLHFWFLIRFISRLHASMCAYMPYSKHKNIKLFGWYPFSALVFSDLCSNFLLPPSKGTASPYEVENASPWEEYTVGDFSHSNKYTHGITYLTCQKLISPCYLKIPFLGIYFTAQTLWRTAPGMRGATCIQKLFRHRRNAPDTALESPEFILYNSNIT